MIKLILLSVIFLNFISGILVVGKHESSWNNRLFCIVSFFASLWAFANYLTGMFHSPFPLELTYASASLVMASGLLWIFSVTHIHLEKKYSTYILFCFGILAAASFFPSFIATRYDVIYLGGVFIGSPNFGLYIAVSFFIVAVLIMLQQLFIAQKLESDVKRRLQLAYIFWGIFCTATISLFTSFTLPSFYIFKFSGLPSISFLLFLICVGYVIVRNNVFTAKVVAAELIIFSLWACTLVQIFTLDTASDQVVSALLLLVSIGVGVQLRKSVITEIRQKEKLEILREKLEATNEQLTELNTLKTEFLSFATHQLRSPLSAVSGYALMLYEGSAGAISEKQKEIVGAMSEATRHLSLTVEDFLNV